MKILLIGPQGSGKSTQADLLAQHSGVPKISTGDIFRRIREEGSDEGRRIKNILDSGQLVDDQTTAEIVRKRVSEEDCKNGFVMDGYPRTLEQLNMFDPEFDKVIYLNVPKETVIKRLLLRGRADDTEELIRRRLDLYYKQTQPLLDYYNSQGILVEVGGTGDIQKIQDEIKKHI
ncbi:adenylate kinase [Candidatus Daviesbacteria bacterium]|nr:adenylate kinase [Candidatus Daviesbacteria bacterium]